MSAALTTDPFVTSMGLAPRYWRERMAAAAAMPPVAAPAPALPAAPRQAGNVDGITAELRRRVLTARPRPTLGRLVGLN